MTTDDARTLAKEYQEWAANTTGGESARAGRAASALLDLATQLDGHTKAAVKPAPAPTHAADVAHAKADAKAEKAADAKHAKDAK